MKVNIPIMKSDPLVLVTDETEWEWDEERGRFRRLDAPDETWAEMVTIEGSEENIKIVLERLSGDA